MEKKYFQNLMAGVFTNISELTRKGIVSIAYLDFMKASWIYRMSQ